MNVSEKIIQYLADYGVEHIFTVSGGGSIFLNDALGKSKRIKYICCHHEQAVAMAAESYARMKKSLGVSMVTTGPGGTNAITGIAGAWMDSVPTLTISGQVFLEQTIKGTNLRQLGIQEINIVDIVKPITKYAVMVERPEDVIYEIQQAIYIANEGRPGPTWVDIPANIQNSSIKSSDYKIFQSNKSNNTSHKFISDNVINDVKRVIKKAKRPLIYIGRGIQIANAEETFFNFVQKTGIPFVTSWSASELVASDHPLYVGRPGMFGQRHANFIIQNSDLMFIIGARLSIPQISYNFKDFGRNAFKIMVDIDKAELGKKTLDIDIKINADAGFFLKKIDNIFEGVKVDYSNWLDFCNNLEKKYPLVLKEWKKAKDPLNSYNFIDFLSEKLKGDDVIVTDMGLAFTGTHQSFRVKKGQRFYTNSGFASMGWGLPAAIGACFGNSNKRVICIVGDGGFQMTSQELATIMHYKLPIKIFIYNNGGYLTIKQTQEINFNDRLMGCNNESGLSFPKYIELGRAYDIKSICIKNQVNLSAKIDKVLEYNGPVLCELIMDQNQLNIPKSAPKILSDGSIIRTNFEDLFPFLNEEEIKSNLLT
jgi:acetolactate synthase-1/2/3 large subunit|tara:strand:+ start:559 stop:2340 length:1782 start_codon:yes stop_codon:yes gene_type:complete